MLGFLCSQAETPTGLIAKIKHFGAEQFTPTADFIQARLIGLIDQGHVTFRDDDESMSITPAGRVQITQLLRLELDPTASLFKTVWTTMKVCLLDLVDGQTRDDIASALYCARDCCPTLASADGLQTCPLLARYLTIEQKRRDDDRRFWQDTLLEEGYLDPMH